MYLTPLDTVVSDLKNDIYNQKQFRPYIVYRDQTIRHLLFPDIPKYIFNFVFDSDQKQITSEVPYGIDVLCKQKYGSPNAYQLVTYVNGYKGIQDYVDLTTVLLPNELIDFVTKYRNVYTQDNAEEPVEIPEELQEIQTQQTMSTSSYVDYLTQTFGSLFVEVS